MERSDVAFTGRLVERIDPDPLLTSSDAVRYVFEVELVHKGSVGPRVEVESAVQSTSCGAVVSEEFPMFVVASKEGGRLTTSLCAGNRPITDLEGPPRIAGQAPAPPAGQRQQPTSTDEVAAPAARASCEDGSVDCDDTGGRTDYTLIASLAAGAALAVAAAAGAVWMSRRRARAQ